MSSKLATASAAWLGDVERVLLRNARRLVEAAVFGVPWLVDDLTVIFFRIGRLAKARGGRFKVACGHTLSCGRSRLLFRLLHQFHNLLLDLCSATHLWESSYHLQNFRGNQVGSVLLCNHLCKNVQRLDDVATLF